MPMTAPDTQEIAKRLLAARRAGKIGTVWTEGKFVRIHAVTPGLHRIEDAAPMSWQRADQYLRKLGM